MATQPHPPSKPEEDARAHPPASVEEERARAQKQRAERAKQIFDENEDEDDDTRPITTQTDQLIRSAEMEEVGPSNWMEEQERRIRERQGEEPRQPRQVPGVASPQKPR